MNTYFKSLRHCPSALRASLTSPSWVYCLHDPTSTLSLVGHELNQRSTRSIRDISTIFFFLNKILYVQVLMRDKVIFIYEFLRNFRKKK